MDAERLLDAPASALRDAPNATGRFPLVIFAHASPETEFLTAEYLASYGYVVAAVRSRGAQSVEYRLTRDNLDAVVSDLDAAVRRMRIEPNVAAGPAGVIGMSNGAIAAVALQLSTRDIGAIVSLDGGIGENAGGTYLRERSGGDTAKFTAPILHLYTRDNSFLNLEHLRSYTASSRTLVAFDGMRHRDFLSYPAFDRVAARFSGNDARPEGHEGFVWLNRYTLHYLDAHLSHTPHGIEFLNSSPERLGPASASISIERLP